MGTATSFRGDVSHVVGTRRANRIKGKMDAEKCSKKKSKIHLPSARDPRLGGRFVCYIKTSFCDINHWFANWYFKAWNLPLKHSSLLFLEPEETLILESAPSSHQLYCISRHLRINLTFESNWLHLSVLYNLQTVRTAVSEAEAQYLWRDLKISKWLHTDSPQRCWNWTNPARKIGEASKGACRIKKNKNLRLVLLPNVHFHWDISVIFTLIHICKTKNPFKLHPSIHFLYPVNPSVGSRGGWSLSQRSLGERRGRPWTGRQSITGPHRDKRDKRPHTRSHSLLRTILETLINLTCMFLDGGRKPEYPERTHTHLKPKLKLRVRGVHPPIKLNHESV